MDENEVEELDPELQGIEPQEQEEPEGEAPEGQPAEPAEDEVVVTIGDEPAPEQEAERAPEWVRDLRKKNQETARENRELRKKLEAMTAPAAEQVNQPGEKPTLAACEYDEEAFEKKLAKWYDDKRAHEDAERKKQEAGQKAQQAYQVKLTAYQSAKSDLKVSDFEEAEAEVVNTLSQMQQSLIVAKAKNSALVVYAVGKNPKKAAELASITDPVDFALAVRDLETQMKVTPKKQAPLPESSVRGNARIGGIVGDSTLDKLRADADRTGDRTKVAAYMRQMNQKKRA